jgi:hypothetical protein
MDTTPPGGALGEREPIPCVFERALLARHAVCELAVAHQIAERETFACTHAPAREECRQLAGLLREKSAFALHLADTQRILPHAMIMKLQCGGLDGMKAVFDPLALAPNVRRLLRLARERHGALEDLPFSEIVKGIAAWKPRRRSQGGPR